MAGWTTADMPDLTGKIAVITGASDGLGLETARALALKGADVILAVRSMKKGGEALEKIKKDVPNADVKLKELDLSNLQSVNVFAESMCDAYGSLDLLINNAGVMMPPYKKTTDGFELQFGVNHLGHFALTGQLMPIIQAAENPRIVTLSSLAAHKASIDFDNLDGVTGYRAYTFYAQSKFANLLFAVKLQNKLKNEAAHVKSFVCHPGLSQSNLLSRGGGARGKGSCHFYKII
ncbi:probable oxidoreductase/short-chain dehydrogenase [Geomicrobium sp. JCM 19037]|uniref:oxidoreductase n=1 Tax=Geomicrobium sp. JCM 19037 TaxID=1460634 RepID=UPI00045F45AC|nr:oxidoreductase [Geomicrobium sp. JCM 19037]GAK03484.1 probable oxidoreductase/short-chain dehydrogenase [Geomicrobium sp. JCM 19037]